MSSQMSGISSQLPVIQIDQSAVVPTQQFVTKVDDIIQQLPPTVTDKEKPTVKLQRDANGYTATVALQAMAKDGQFTARVDAGLVEAVLTALSGRRDGRISVEDVHKYLEPALRDGVKGNKYSEAEKPVVRVLLAAMDGRVKAFVGDDQVHWGGKDAARAFLGVVRSVIGHDAAVARWHQHAEKVAQKI
jgi:hypothetical protein